jgi:DNA polymerase beta
MTDHKAKIIEELDVMRRADIARRKPFQAKAYAKAIEQLRAMSGPVTSYEDVKDIPGAGKKIQEKMKEIIETGGLKAAAQAKEETSLDAMDILTAIHGVGPVKAKDLIKAGITTIAKLRTEVTKTPGLLNDVQKMGLKYYEDGKERIPRAEMEMHEKRIIGDMDDAFQAVVVGSFRRGAASSGDIDVLLTLPASMSQKDQKTIFKKEVDRMTAAGYIVDTLAVGDKKFMGYVRLSSNHKARRLDLLMTPQAEFAYAILYFTGSQEFNVGFRQFVKDKGYTINEHEMKPEREGLPAVPPMKTEKDIFDFLGLQYVEPNMRRSPADVKMKVSAATESKEQEETKEANRSRSRSRSRSSSRNETKKAKKPRKFKVTANTAKKMAEAATASNTKESNE